MKARTTTLHWALVVGATLVGCTDTEAPSTTPDATLEASDSGASDATSVAPTYFGEAKAIIDARCATCHKAGDIGPFPLTTYDEVSAFAGVVRASIVNGTMPPWQPADDCNTYLDSIDLTAEEKEVVVAWLDAGAPEGEPRDEAASSAPPGDAPFEVDMSLQLPEPYTPTLEPDDHRCQLIPWPATETRFVTGSRVTPDQRSIVHHVIIFVVGLEQVAQYQAYETPKRTGQPVSRAYARQPVSGEAGKDQDYPASLIRQIGFWVPGMRASPFLRAPIRVEPARARRPDAYNTSSSAPSPISPPSRSPRPTPSREATARLISLGDQRSDHGGHHPSGGRRSPRCRSPLTRSSSPGPGIPWGSLKMLRWFCTRPAITCTSWESHHTEIRTPMDISCLLDTPDWTCMAGTPHPQPDQLWSRDALDGVHLGQLCEQSAYRRWRGEGARGRGVGGALDEMCLSGFYVTGQ